MQNETAEIEIRGWKTQAVQSTPRIWAVEMNKTGIVWKLIAQVNNPGIFNLYNSSMKSLSQTFRLADGKFSPVQPL